MDSKGHLQLTASIFDMLNEGKKKTPLDPVGKEDADIDNDGDTDKTDDYLLNRRKKRKEEIQKAKKTKPKKPKKTLNERKIEVLNLLLGEENGGDADSVHPFDAESTAGDIHRASMHDHIEDNGGLPLTPQNIEKHGIVHDEIREPDKSYFDIDATKGPHKNAALELYKFTGPNNETAHGLFSNRGRDLGELPFTQHKEFTGTRVRSADTSAAIDHHDIPEVGIDEGWKKKKKKTNYSTKEIQEATLNRIKSIGSTNKAIFESHSGLDRIR